MKRYFYHLLVDVVVVEQAAAPSPTVEAVPIVPSETHAEGMAFSLSSFSLSLSFLCVVSTAEMA